MNEKIKNIPEELFQAFKQKDIGYSLLIKGDAGTGKSTFALTLLSLFKEAEPIYISTRVAPSSLYRQFPWIEGHLKEENILDATRTYLPPISDPKELRTHVLRTIRFSDAPEFLKIVYDKIEKNKSSIVVIDSWDAIVGIGGYEKSLEWETIFTEFVRQMNVKLILISEHSKNTFLDYIVDGIIKFKDLENEDGRILREMEINKIRGIERKQKYYSFSLFNNSFMYCPPFFEDTYEFQAKSNGSSMKKWPPLQSDNNNYYSTGSKEIDKLYQGGLKNSSLNLWEIESDVPLSAFSNIMIPLLCNFITQDYGAILYSNEGLNSRFINKNKLFINLNMEKISNNLRYIVENLDEHLPKKNDIRPYVVPILNEDLEKTFSKIYSELAEQTSFKPVLSIVGYDFLSENSRYYSEIYNHLKFVRNYNIIEIGIINQVKNSKSRLKTPNGYSKKNLHDISYFFDTHMKLIFKNNAIFVYGIKPYSGLYWVKFYYYPDTPLPKISLIPMV